MTRIEQAIDSNPDWHFCKDELPREERKYLCRLGNVGEGYYDYEVLKYVKDWDVCVGGKWNTKPAFIGSDRDVYYPDDDCNTVIAWMELPKFV